MAGEVCGNPLAWIHTRRDHSRPSDTKGLQVNIEKMKELWNHHEDEEFLNFAGVANKKSKRADLHAFLLLNEIVPGKEDIISAAEHDEFFSQHRSLRTCRSRHRSANRGVDSLRCSVN